MASKHFSASLELKLLRLHFSLRDVILPSLADKQLSALQWRVLSVLLTNGKTETGTLATLTCTAKPTLTRVLTNLTADGLVLRERQAGDRRTILNRLSPDGQALSLEMSGTYRELLAPIAAEFGDHDFETLCDLVARLSKQISLEDSA